MELHLGMDEELTKSLRVRIKGRAGTGDIIVEVCYRLPDQEDWVDEVLYRQIGTASPSQALVLMADFNHPNICRRHNTAGYKQSRRFLECIDNFVLHVTEELCWTLFSPTRRHWWGMWSSRAVLAAAPRKSWSSRSLGQWGACIASSLPSTSAQQTSASSGICLADYHGIKPWRKEEPKKAG